MFAKSGIMNCFNVANIPSPGLDGFHDPRYYDRDPFQAPKGITSAQGPPSMVISSSSQPHSFSNSRKQHTAQLSHRAQNVKNQYPSGLPPYQPRPPSRRTSSLCNHKICTRPKQVLAGRIVCGLQQPTLGRKTTSFPVAARQSSSDSTWDITPPSPTPIAPTVHPSAIYDVLRRNCIPLASVSHKLASVPL